MTALLGRRAEREQLAQVLRSVRGGRSRVLVLRGDAGVGKTALLRYLREQAAGCHVARAAGIQSEMELAFSGLHQLCAPFLDRTDRLPVPQRNALDTIFGDRLGDPPDRFLVGLAVLGLLAGVAEDQPLVCIVDDVQWLDRASTETLGFVARRLGADPVGLVFAVRDDAGPVGALAGLPALEVHGLAAADARVLLESAVSGPLDPLVRDRVVAETRGNPLALVELPRALTSSQLAYGFAVGNPVALAGRLEEGFLARVRALGEPAGRLLLLAAAEPTGDVSLLWRAAARLDIPTAAAADAQQSGLLELSTQVRFRHPLVRSAVYRGALLPQRQAAHRALADATDPLTDPDRRAWHRAQATPGVDETVATALQTSAGRARARGGMAAAAAFLSRATELTPDPARRAERALAAAAAALQAGDTERASVLVALAEAGPLADLDSARAELLRAQIDFTATRGREAPSLLLTAARRLERLDATLAKETYLDAFAAALFAGRMADRGRARTVADAVRTAAWGPATRQLPEACSLLLEGLARLLTDGYAAGAPALRDALAGFRAGRMREEDELRWLWLAARLARALGDDATWDELTARQVRLAREVGALAVLPMALTERFTAELFAGHLDGALVVAAEAEAVVAATGAELSPHIAYLLAAWRGDEAATRALLEAHSAEVAARGEGLWLVGTDWTSAVFLNSLGRYDEALAAAERAAEFPDDLGLSTWVLPELVEAAVRSGHPERAGPAMVRLSEVAAASDTDWLGGVTVRSQAMLAAGPEADRLYRQAVERLGRTRIRVALARAHLLYGEWLRRERRRAECREQLNTAHEIFLDLGMAAFAERSRRELVATGASVRSRSVDTLHDLTAQEAQIARLAAAGHSNPEIGAQLFLSPRTVEWHLGNVYGKVGVKSRRELADALRRAG